MKIFPTCRQADHQKTAFRRILEILPQIGLNLAYHLFRILSYTTKNVKHRVEVAGFAPAEPWMISQIPYSSTPTRSVVYHVLLVFFSLLFTLISIPYLRSAEASSVYTLSPVYAQFGPDPAGLTQIEEVFTNVIRVSVAGAFVALFVVLVWAGIKFLTSGGEPKALEAARNTVTWALLGILFLAIAWLVLQLIAAFTGIEGLKTFDIGKLCIPPVNLGNCVPISTPTPTP